MSRRSRFSHEARGSKKGYMPTPRNTARTTTYDVVANHLESSSTASPTACHLALFRRSCSVRKSSASRAVTEGASLLRDGEVLYDLDPSAPRLKLGAGSVLQIFRLRHYDPKYPHPLPSTPEPYSLVLRASNRHPLQRRQAIAANDAEADARRPEAPWEPARRRDPRHGGSAQRAGLGQLHLIRLEKGGWGHAARVTGIQMFEKNGLLCGFDSSKKGREVPAQNE